MLLRLEGTGPAWLVRAWKQGGRLDCFTAGKCIFRDILIIAIKVVKNCRILFLQCIHGTQRTRKPKILTVQHIHIGAWTKSNYYLVWAWAAKVEFPELKRKAKDLYNAQLPHAVWVEDKASGQSLVQGLKRNYYAGSYPC